MGAQHLGRCADPDEGRRRGDAFVAALPREAPPRAFIAPWRRARRARARRVSSSLRALPIRRLPARLARYRRPARLSRRAVRPETTGAITTPSPTAPTAGPASPSSSRCPTTASAPPCATSPMCPPAGASTRPGDRRFHAEPNACPVCGPQVALVDVRRGPAGQGRTSGRWGRGGRRGEAPADGREAPGDPPVPLSSSAGAVLASRGDAAIARAAELLRPAASWPSRASAASTSPATPRRRGRPGGRSRAQGAAAQAAGGDVRGRRVNCAATARSHRLRGAAGIPGAPDRAGGLAEAWTGRRAAGRAGGGQRAAGRARRGRRGGRGIDRQCGRAAR